MNFDNEVAGGTDQTIDWPVSFIFKGPYARVDGFPGMNQGVKGLLKLHGYTQTGGAMHLGLKDTGSAVIDSDTGLKNTFSGQVDCRNGTTPVRSIHRHMRVYGPPDSHQSNFDRMHNSTLGYYVPATVHLDRNEDGSCEGFGWSENAEDYFAVQFSLSSWSVCVDCIAMNNDENYVITTSTGYNGHYSNGWASVVDMSVSINCVPNDPAPCP